MPLSSNIYRPSRLADVEYARYLYVTELIELEVDLEDEIIDEDASEKAGSDVIKADADPQAVIDLRLVRQIIEEVGGYSRAKDTTLIADEEFANYAKEFAEDTNADLYGYAWPLDHINWEAAADDLRTEFTSITINGKDYWYQ